MNNLSDYINEALRLGSGEEATCYLTDDDKVKKVFKRGVVPVTYKILYQACKFADIQCLPHIYDIGDDYIIRDSYDVKSPACKKHYNIACKRFEGMKMFQWVALHTSYDEDTDTYDIDEYTEELNDEEQKVFDWLCRLKYEMSQIAGDKAGMGDFGLQNLGEDKGGNIVMYDF